MNSMNGVAAPQSVGEFDLQASGIRWLILQGVTFLPPDNVQLFPDAPFN
jgi:hypothetical protein